MSAKLTEPSVPGFFRHSRWLPAVSPSMRRWVEHFKSQGITVRFIHAGSSVALYREGTEVVTDGAARQRLRKTNRSD